MRFHCGCYCLCWSGSCRLGRERGNGLGRSGKLALFEHAELIGSWALASEQQEDHQADDDDTEHTDDGRRGGAHSAGDAFDEAVGRKFSDHDGQFFLHLFAVVIGRRQHDRPTPRRQVGDGPGAAGEVNVTGFRAIKVGVKVRAVPLKAKALRVGGRIKDEIRPVQGQVITFREVGEGHLGVEVFPGWKVQDTDVHALLSGCTVVIGDGHRDHSNALGRPRRGNGVTGQLAIVVDDAVVVAVHLGVKVPANGEGLEVGSRICHVYAQFEGVVFEDRRVARQSPAERWCQVVHHHGGLLDFGGRPIGVDGTDLDDVFA